MWSRVSPESRTWKVLKVVNDVRSSLDLMRDDSRLTR